MKKLVFSLMVLFLTSENIARGSFFQLGLGYDHFYTYDLLNRGKEKLIQGILPNTDYKINFNPQLLSINKKIKIYLDVSVGLALRSSNVTEKQIAEYEKVIKNKINFLYINEKIGEEGLKILFTSVEKSQGEKWKVSIGGFLLDETEHKPYALKDIEVKDLLTSSNHKNKIAVYPYNLTGVYAPCSIGISTKIKIHKKTFIKISLRGYISFNFFNSYKTILTDLCYCSNIENWSEKIVKSVFGNSRDTSEIISFYNDNFPLFLKKPMIYLILFTHNIDNSYQEKYYYGGIFNIAISSKIYKHIEINISLSSLEFCYVKDPIGEEENSHKQTAPFNGKNYALFLHLPSFGILLV